MNKLISKITLLSTVLTLFIVASANAAGGNVLTLEASQNKDSGEISFSGTTDDDVIAVSCILSDASGEEVFFGSTEVESAAFGGSFSMPVDDYTMKCANYDGGDFVTVALSEEATERDEEEGEEEDEEETDVPQTGQLTNTEGGSASTSPVIWIIAIAAGLIAIGTGIAIIISRRKKA